ncbi:calcium uniporter protein [Tanacetum coccineum]
MSESSRIYRGKEIMTDMNARFKIDISYSQAWRAKCYALQLLRGTPQESFSELPLYCHNLKLKNQGTITHIETDDEDRFEIFFLAIGAVIRTFVLHMRPLIIIDGAHLKGEFLGTMYLAVAMDGNNQILPLAYGVGKSETFRSWDWFLTKLKECIIGKQDHLTIISDGATKYGENDGGNSDPSKMETVMGYMGSPMLHRLESFITDVSRFRRSIEKANKQNLDNHPIVCVAAVYVFAQSLPHNSLWIPTMLMFMTGIMKYSERTRLLYLASADRFKDLMLTEPDPGPNYIKIMDELNSIKEGNLPTRIQMVLEPDRAAKSADKAKKGNLTELEVVQYGYQFFDKFKGLVVDMHFSRKERNQSQDFFLNRNAKDAFKVVEVELNFIYKVLFTKLPVVDADVMITYGLLFGALVLDMTALIMLLFSDWTIISLRKSPNDEPVMSLRTTIITALLRLRTEGRPWETKDTPQLPLKLSSFILERRWSETISTYNLISYYLYPLPETWKYVCHALGLTGFTDGIAYVNREDCTDKLKECIFNELKSKSELAEDLETTKEIISARGDWVLRVEEGWRSLLKYVVDVDYDECLILWHITTDLCYSSDLYDYIKYRQQIIVDEDMPQKIKVDEYKPEIANFLSNYMFYLLIMQPNMISAVAGIGQIRFRDTCAEAKRFFNYEKGGEQSKIRDITFGERTRGMDLKHINACKDILINVSIEVPPVTVKGDKSKSFVVLCSQVSFEANCIP